LFLPTIRLGGSHQLKLGVDLERQAFHQKSERHPYQVMRGDDSVARYVTFEGSPFMARKNFEGSYYLQDAWTPREGLLFEAGLRAEWNQIIRRVEPAPGWQWHGPRNFSVIPSSPRGGADTTMPSRSM